MVMDAATNASTTAGKCTLYSNGIASETESLDRIAVNNSWFHKVPKNWVLVWQLCVEWDGALCVTTVYVCSVPAGAVAAAAAFSGDDGREEGLDAGEGWDDDGGSWCLRRQM